MSFFIGLLMALMVAFTGSQPANSVAPTAPQQQEQVTQVEKQTVDNEIWYGHELGDRLLAKYREVDVKKDSLRSAVRDGQTYYQYNGKELPAVRNIDYYYDEKNDRTYLARSFLLQLIDPVDLENLPEYQVDLQNKTVNKK